MAAHERVTEASTVVGVLVPGDGRLRFCIIDIEGPQPGEWVALSDTFGEEPAQIVFTAEQIELPDASAELPLVLRRLNRAEVEALGESIERAQRLMSPVKAIVALVDPSIAIIGIRFTLAAKTLVCRCFGGDAISAAALVAALREQLALPVEIEWSSGASASYGSAGRLRSKRLDLDAAVRARLGLNEMGDAPVTPRLPHLGALIQCTDGPGILLSISMRHQSATVRLDSGDETTLPLKDLL